MFRCVVAAVVADDKFFAVFVVYGSYFTRRGAPGNRRLAAVAWQNRRFQCGACNRFRTF